MATRNSASLTRQVSQAFQEIFGGTPCFIARAPGRVNLIGEHTDYNDGFVLPMAIDRAVYIAFCARQDGHVRLHSLDLKRSAKFDLDALSLPEKEAGGNAWEAYVEGVAWALQEAGYKLRGWQGVVSGNVPIGAGLSSSAALELAAARAFATVSELAWEPATMARLAQRAENEWVGVACGIMDQMISASGQEGHALLIDCRSLQTEAVPLPGGTSVVVLDTGTRRGLVESAYNERRAQCEAAARFFGVPALRDVDVDAFEARAGEMDELTRRRARHVITENARTLQAVQAMHRDDARAVGQLMDGSHASLRDDFEVSSEALNTMVAIAGEQEGCLGARMTGAGFGGCAVALVEARVAETFARNVARTYQEAVNLEPAVYVSRAAAGAEVAPAPSIRDS
ncbi:MAG TPA: galactokinase [Candidatus Sulfomarinibacteraceae bacterium]|nr:galactokinase [Candidatus Sulfomarinibacteraceae bacterium]